MAKRNSENALVVVEGPIEVASDEDDVGKVGSSEEVTDGARVVVEVAAVVRVDSGGSPDAVSVAEGGKVVEGKSAEAEGMGKGAASVFVGGGGSEEEGEEDGE